MADFEDRKSRALAAIESDSPDRSRKGGIDAPIATLISRVNAHPDFFTTSSCSGRITLFTEPGSDSGEGGNAEESNASRKARKKKKGGEWVLVSHEPVVGEEIVAAVRGFASGGSDLLVFRFEPFILALDCVSVAAAQEFVACAIASGFRESGISGIKKRIMVAIRCSIRLEVPVAEKGELLVSDDYLIYLSTLANRKMEQNRLRTEKFLDAFITQFQSGASASLDSIIEVTNDEHFKAADTNGGDSHEPEDINELGCSVANKNASLQSQGILERNTSFSRTHTGWIDERPGSLLRAQPLSENPGILHRWGHSSCTVDSSVVIFGGYGSGTGSHSRLDDIVSFSPRDQKLHQRRLKISPRMAHSASAVKGEVWIIGGRWGPHNLLGDVLLIDARNLELVNFPAISGDLFTPRHRHAAAVVGEKIYVYGGLGNGGALLGDLLVLDTNSRSWTMINPSGEIPQARYSHTLSAVGEKLYLIGGFDGKKIFEDLHVFEIETSRWFRVSARGDAPVPRFSHTSTVIGKFIAVLGGCPTTEQMNTLFFLDVSKLEWRCFHLELPDETLLVRHAASLVDELLVVTGGGASCYAFGTMFSSSFLVDLQFLKLDKSS